MMRLIVMPAAPLALASGPSDEARISVGDQEWLTTRSESSVVMGPMSEGRELGIDAAEDNRR